MVTSIHDFREKLNDFKKKTKSNCVKQDETLLLKPIFIGKQSALYTNYWEILTINKSG